LAVPVSPEVSEVEEEVLGWISDWEAFLSLSLLCMKLSSQNTDGAPNVYTVEMLVAVKMPLLLNMNSSRVLMLPPIE
jgi:hypothetical protein